VIEFFQLDAALALDAVLASMTGCGQSSSLIPPEAQLAASGEVRSLELIGMKP
jgi:predicted small lipoprotein YifL